MLLLDTNLLVLLIVGSASRTFIPFHKRTRAYTIDDYILLGTFVSATTLVTTPNILSETSNLIRQFGDPHRSQVIDVFAAFSHEVEEVYIPSADAVRGREFRRFGLTDAAILSTLSGDVTLVTDDLDLYMAAALAGQRVINFAHERESLLR